MAIKLLDIQPTAYDIDAVVEELISNIVKYQQYEYQRYDYELGFEDGCEYAFDKATEIVRGGVVNNE